MNNTRDTTTGAFVIVGALMAGLAMAMLDMAIDNLRLVLALLIALGFLFGLMAPRWAFFGGLSVGAVLPVAQVYVTSFDLRLPHPMHGFYYGTLAVAPPVVSALVGMWVRDRVDEILDDRRHEARLASESVGVKGGVKPGVGSDIGAARDASARNDRVRTKSPM